jgi:pimeloyl-ACP methyl ester carboxylesterase
LDGLLHDESWDALSKAVPHQRPLVLLMHGAGSNFYGPSLINRVGTHLFRLGWPVLRVNNRGHDGWHAAFRGGKLTPMGAAFERLEESLWDIQAWLGWAARNGYPRVVLAGHSLGAFKIVYALAHGAGDAQRPQIETAVAISPPCLSSQLFAGSDHGRMFLATAQRCEALVAEGKGDEIFRAQYPFPMWLSAACYLNKYASGERFNFTCWLQQIRSPVFWLYGGGELGSHIALARGVEQLEQALPAGHRLSTLPEADHFFTGWSSDVCLAVEKWLEPYQ